MMITKECLKHNSQNLLQKFSHLFIVWLQPKDIVEFMVANKQIYSQLNQNKYISNYLYFSIYLSPQESIMSLINQTQRHKQYSLQKIDSVVLSFKGDELIGSFGNINYLHNELASNINLLVQNQYSHQITNSFIKSIRTPERTFPQMRRQTIGDFCDNQFQIYVTGVLINCNNQKMLQEPYSNLKTALIQRIQDTILSIKSQVQQNSQFENILFSLKLKPQSLNNYIQTKSVLVNILQLIIISFDCHLGGVIKYLDHYMQLSPPFQFLNQFITRYSTFNQTILYIESKLGFLMNIFNKSMQIIYPNVNKYPDSSFWRCMIKKWINKTKHFQDYLNKGYIQLFINMRLDNINQLINTRYNKLENQSLMIQSQYRFQYEAFLSKYQMNSEQFKIIAQQSSGSLPVTLYKYMQYLMDTSINDYSVHWCQSSKQKLSSNYNKCEQLILEVFNELYTSLNKIFQQKSLGILKQIYQKDIHFLNIHLKPCTLVKILNEIKKRHKMSLLKADSHIQYNIERIDKRIKFINERRGIPLQIEINKRDLLQFDQTIQPCQFNAIVKELKGKSQQETQPEEILHCRKVLDHSFPRQ